MFHHTTQIKIIAHYDASAVKLKINDVFIRIHEWPEFSRPSNQQMSTVLPSKAPKIYQMRMNLSNNT